MSYNYKRNYTKTTHEILQEHNLKSQIYLDTNNVNTINQTEQNQNQNQKESKYPYDKKMDRIATGFMLVMLLAVLIPVMIDMYYEAGKSFKPIFFWFILMPVLVLEAWLLSFKKK